MYYLKKIRVTKARLDNMEKECAVFEACRHLGKPSETCQAAGSSLQEVVACEVSLRDLKDFEAVNKAIFFIFHASSKSPSSLSAWGFCIVCRMIYCEHGMHARVLGGRLHCIASLSVVPICHALYTCPDVDDSLVTCLRLLTKTARASRLVSSTVVGQESIFTAVFSFNVLFTSRGCGPSA